MNSFILLFIGVPAVEVFLMIKIGGEIGALNTVSLILLTAIIGIYFAKLEGIKTMRSGVMNLYQNKIPIYEMISGASIAIAALLLIIPGFFTDSIGFLLLIPFTRKILINFLVNKQNISSRQEDKKTLDGEIIEDKKDEL
tara:strand:+ start:252 stop:671 length:420 start_codon:yes stop_codon:yes gene_type:complete